MMDSTHDSNHDSLIVRSFARSGEGPTFSSRHVLGNGFEIETVGPHWSPATRLAPENFIFGGSGHRAQQTTGGLKHISHALYVFWNICRH